LPAGPGLPVVGAGGGLREVAGAVTGADSAGLALDADPPALLVLVGQDHDMVGHPGLSPEDGSDADELLPPGAAVPADREHVRRAGLQGGHDLGQVRTTDAPDPAARVTDTPAQSSGESIFHSVSPSTFLVPLSTQRGSGLRWNSCTATVTGPVG